MCFLRAFLINFCYSESYRQIYRSVRLLYRPVLSVPDELNYFIVRVPTKTGYDLTLTYSEFVGKVFIFTQS